MILFHLALSYRNKTGEKVNRFGEPFTVDQEGLKRSRSHPVCLTPSLGHATVYASDNRNRAANAIVYAIESSEVPGIRQGGEVWTSEHVPVGAIRGTIRVRVTEEMTARDVQYQIEKAGRCRGWM